MCLPSDSCSAAVDPQALGVQIKRVVFEEFDRVLGQQRVLKNGHPFPGVEVADHDRREALRLFDEEPAAFLR